MHAPHRLRESGAFDRARKLGRSWANGCVILNAVANETPATRFGFAVSRRVGGAVVRNKVKRRLRAIASGVVPRIAAGWDLVLVARPPAAAATFADLEAAVHDVLRRGRVLREAGSASGPPGPAAG